MATVVRRVAIVTGANVGIGLETAAGLLKRAYRVVFACRSAEKAKCAMDALGVRGLDAESAMFLPLDLASLESVKSFVRQFRHTNLVADVIVANAGLMSTVGKPTIDGFEEMFQVNHLGHFYLVNLLLTANLVSSTARIVMVSSSAAERGKLQLNRIRTPETSTLRCFDLYGNSKLYNHLFALELQQRLRSQGSSIDVFGLHPGVVQSEFSKKFTGFNGFISRLYFRMVGVSREKGALTSIYAATAPELTGAGCVWLENCKIATCPNKLALQPELRKELWEASEKLLNSDYTL
eukprot:TRINITY_DN6632_c0_g1_i1.p1 TRINITY_DN6632_c0_g1~~TRINITY_DN6632_c0_g1_i1.p1  ORF type:complete len:293 (-),score=36.36 TRINITY_DN6632_c0_g1_i1:53-931(-)